MIKIGNVRFAGLDCAVLLGSYGNGRPALSLVEQMEDGFGDPICSATANVPEAELGPMETLIKDYSENTGILDVLEEAGLVEVQRDGPDFGDIMVIRSGHVALPVVRVTRDTEVGDEAPEEIGPVEDVTIRRVDVGLLLEQVDALGTMSFMAENFPLPVTKRDRELLYGLLTTLEEWKKGMGAEDQKTERHYEKD